MFWSWVGTPFERTAISSSWPSLPHPPPLPLLYSLPYVTIGICIFNSWVKKKSPRPFCFSQFTDAAPSWSEADVFSYFPPPFQPTLILQLCTQVRLLHAFHAGQLKIQGSLKQNLRATSLWSPRGMGTPGPGLPHGRIQGWVEYLYWVTRLAGLKEGVASQKEAKREWFLRMSPMHFCISLTF